MIRSPPSLQQICVRSVVETQDLHDVLYPYEDWDTEEIPRNDRLTQDEKWDYQTLTVTGQKTLTECKNDLRSMLYRRPFDLDLVQLRKLPMFDGLPDYSVRQVWAETIILEWEGFVPGRLGGLLEWEELVVTWPILNSLRDGCTNESLFELLEREELLLIEQDNEKERLLVEAEQSEIWRRTIGCDWLYEMRFLINFSFFLFY